MVIDCIPFFNELDILNLRLHILDPYVDRFIIEESARTFSGEPKELCFEQYKDMFRDFLPKIDYVVVRDDIMLPDGVTPDPAASRYCLYDPGQPAPHRRDYFQKNHIMDRLFSGWCASDPGSGINGNTMSDMVGAHGKAHPLVSPDDILLFGDLDEIPNPLVLKDIIAHFDRSKVYHLAQRNFYVFLNMEEIPVRLHSITGEFPDIPEARHKWLGTKICSYENIPPEGIVRLRDLVPVTDPRSVRVEDGGWHFGYMGGHHETDVMKRIGTKIRAAAHQEYNDAEIIAETMDKLVLGQDIFGRNAHFERVEVDDTYPQYLLDHRADYEYLIMPRITAWTRFTHRFDLSVGRFARRAIKYVRRRFLKSGTHS